MGTGIGKGIGSTPLPLFDGVGIRLDAAPRRRPRRPDPKAAKRARGAMAYHAGLSAEDQVARHYRGAGSPVLARRWRGSAGEIDIVAEDGEGLIFVEVKSAPTHAEAAESLGERQLARLRGAAEEYLAGVATGSLTNCRIDLALVDGAGRIEIVENLIG